MDLQKTAHHQVSIFALGLIFFIATAAFGWIKLRYGFNFIDEGYHLTKSWRLAAGDSFLEANKTTAHALYPLITSLIFRLNPAITLLGLREVQFGLSILSIFLLSIASYKVEHNFWYLPFIFSIFAFTGLDPTGMISNLNYYTYPHFFLILHVSFFLLGLIAKKPVHKYILFFASGFALWGISFTLLHLSPVAISPIIIFLMLKRLKWQSFKMTKTDLFFTLLPFALCWLIFISTFKSAYIFSIINSVKMDLSVTKNVNTSSMATYWDAIEYVFTAFIFLATYIISIQIKRTYVSLGILSILSISMFLIIHTCFFHLIVPFHGWFGHQMWFSSILIAFMILYWIVFLKKYSGGKNYTMGDQIAFLILIPATILSLFTSIFSGNGALTVLHSSAPIIAALSLTIIYHIEATKKPFIAKLIILSFLLAPFYFFTAWADWQFTYFDLTPVEAKVTIQDGFGAGLKTNKLYAAIYEWIEKNTNKYSKTNDFMISYIVSPMVHMIAHRRPSLSDTFIDFRARHAPIYKTSIDEMKQLHREPKLAFVFEKIPMLSPDPLTGEYRWLKNQFDFTTSNDPISGYIKNSMRLKETLNITPTFKIRCFLDNKSAEILYLQEHQPAIYSQVDELKNKITHHPQSYDPHYQLGRIYQKYGCIDNALEQYQQAVSLQPDSTETLTQLAMLYISKKDYDNAISVLRDRLLKLQPKNNFIFYNIACLYSIQNRKNKAIKWLKEAVDRGYNNWEHLTSDTDLDNIKKTKYYKILINKMVHRPQIKQRP